MENMNTQVGITHMDHPDDEKLLEALSEFESHAKEGFLKLGSADRVMVKSGSEAHQKIKDSLAKQEGKAYFLGEISHNGEVFAEYTLSESFFQS